MGKLLYEAAVDQIISDVNTKNSTTLTSSSVKLSSVTAGDDGFDSKAVLTAITGGGMKSSTPQLSYKRYNASLLFPMPLRVEWEEGDTHASLIKKASSSYLLPDFIIQDKDSTEDIYDFSSSVYDTIVEEGDEEYLSLEFKFSDTSPGYVGNLPLRVKMPGSDSGTKIKVRDLEGLEYPNSLPGTKKNLDIFTSPVPMYNDRYLLSDINWTINESTDSMFIKYYVKYIADWYNPSMTIEEETAMRAELKRLLIGAVVTKTNVPETGDLPDEILVVISPTVVSDTYEGNFVGRSIKIEY